MKKTPINIAIKPMAKKSSAIAGHGYHPESKTLDIQFNGGKTHRYHDVPQSVVDGLAKAKSVGNFVSTQIVGKFKSTPVGAK